MAPYLRLNNLFVFRKGTKYFLTSVKDPSVWLSMNNKQKERSLGKNITKKIKELLKTHSLKGNIHFRTLSSKKKICKTSRKMNGG
jgi:acid phosphatase class B